MLDIMSCGLGAIILVFMLVRFETDVASSEAELLKVDSENLQNARLRLEEELAVLQEYNAKARLETETIVRTVDTLKQNLAQTRSEKTQQAQKLEARKKAIEAIQPQKNQDTVENTVRGEETYLIGLKVEGKRIAILVDTSASMTDYRLLDIIRHKGKPDAERRNTPKWKRTQATVEWLLARLPADAQVALVGFQERAGLLGAKGWSKANDTRALGAILGALRKTVPDGATNLEAGLNAVKKLRPSHLYVITDGLPTKGDSKYKSLNPFAGCSALWGAASTISGPCRQQLFQYSLTQAGPAPDVPVNVILLPLEGDPGAAYLFWLWTARHGGILLSPAEGWP